MKVLCSVVITLMMMQTAVPKAFMPSLDRVRKKVDGAVNDVKGLPLKELLKNQSASTMVNKIITQDGVCDQKPSGLEDVERAIGSLYWVRQHEWVTALGRTKEQSSHQAAQQIKDKIKERYASEKMPLVAYAHALAAEEQRLNEIITMLLKCTACKGPQDAEKLKKLFDEHTRCMQTLQQLTAITNALLM